MITEGDDKYKCTLVSRRVRASPTDINIYNRFVKWVTEEMDACVYAYKLTDDLQWSSMSVQFGDDKLLSSDVKYF